MRPLFTVSAIDPSIAGQLADDLPPEIFRRIIATFEADLARLTGELTQSAGEGDLDGYLRAAHSLAGAAAAVGARRLEVEARTAMDPAQPVSPSEVLPRLSAESRSALQELHQLAGN
ncbi:Hpt domain-containing protein [Rhodovarius crocodyli]|nr:Hpt domain-containing protein [Rhodovarius crocodyli]